MLKRIARIEEGFHLQANYTEVQNLYFEADLRVPEMKTKVPSVFDVDLSEIHLSSTLEVGYRQELEDIFFFNPKQHVVQDRVVDHIKRYGSPEIRNQDDGLTLALKLVDGAQTLFLLIGSDRPRLVGAMIYVREAECLRVPYVVLEEAYTLESKNSCTILLFMVDSMRRIGRSIQGVKFVNLSVGHRDAVFKL